VEFLNKALHTKMLVAKTQTTRKRPAHFRPGPAVIRTRSGVWQLNFHEAGHALSYYLSDTNPDWYEQFAPELTALTQMEGSMASAESAEEGLAEFVRRYVVSPDTLPTNFRRQMEAEIRSLDPDVLASLRDAHRAYAAHRAKPIVEQMRGIQEDKPKAVTTSEAVNNLWWRGLYTLFGPRAVIHRLRRKVFQGTTGDTKVLRPGRTTIVALAKGFVNKAYRSQLALARALFAEIKDTKADFRNAFQTLIHIPQEVQRSVFDRILKENALRVRATGDTFADLPEEVLAELQETFGIKIPPGGVRHGNWIYLGGASLENIRSRVGERDWVEFVAYGQYKAALERYEKKEHPYPGMREGLGPEELRSFIEERETAKPAWKRYFQDVNEYMDKLVLIGVLSGEFSAKEANRILTAWENYWPLPRQIEDRQTRRGGGGITPDSGVRAAFGSDLPFRSLEEAVEVRTKAALEAYYTNRAILALRDFGKAVGAKDMLPFDVRADALRIMLPLKLETRKVAELAEEEQKKMLADAMNRQTAEQIGADIKDLPPELRVRPDDIAMSFPGRPVWRARKPNAVNVVAPFEGGKRVYYQVTDSLLFDMLQMGNRPGQYLQWITELLRGIQAPWKRALTQNIPFAIVNALTRDVSTAAVLGEAGAKTLLPYFYAATGAVNRLKGLPVVRKVTKQQDRRPIIESELLSRSLDATTQKGHQGFVRSFFEMLKEGVVLPGYMDLSLSDKAVKAPGVAMSAALKPLDVVNWLTGGRLLAQLGEKMPREGAYLSKLRQGFSEEEAQRAYDETTGDFGQRPGNPNLASLVRAAGFLNPALRIMWTQAERITHPDPAQRAFFFGAKLPAIATWGAIGAALNWLLLEAIYDDDERREVVEAMKERTEKDRLSGFVLGGKVRMPFEYGVIGAVMSYAWNSVEEWLLSSPIEAKTKSQNLLARARDLPGITDIINPYIKTGMELYLNHSFFYDEDIVPAWLENDYPYNPELQTYADTPEVFNAIGRKLGVSPLKVRYAFRSLYTREGDRALNVADKLARNGLLEPSDYPIIGRLSFREPRGRRSRSVRSLLDLDQEFDALKQRMQHLKINSDKDRELAAQLAERMYAVADAKFATDEMEKIWKKVKDERASDAPDNEKVIKFERQMVEHARRFLEERAQVGVEVGSGKRSRRLLGLALYGATATRPTQRQLRYARNLLEAGNTSYNEAYLALTLDWMRRGFDTTSDAFLLRSGRLRNLMPRKGIVE